MDNVFVVSTTYTNGAHEINCVYQDKEKAEKFAEWMKKQNLDDLIVKECNIYEFMVL